MNIGNIKNYENFRRDAKWIFIKKLENFFSAKVTFFEYPLNQLKSEFDIDLQSNPRRGVYYIDNDNVVVIPRIYEKRTVIAYLGISFNKKGIGLNKKIFNVIDGVISKNLSRSYIFGFRDTIQYFDDNFIKKVIANYFSKGYYNPSRIIYAIDYFMSLRTTSFEGEFFSTGMILSRADFAYRGKNSENRCGITHTLLKNRKLEGENIDRRFWYLVDGKQSYYLCNRKMLITHLFNITNEEGEFNYINNLTLNSSLRGGDVLFRIENEKEISIITSDGTEFIFLENQWKYRSYDNIKELICSVIDMSEEYYNFLIFYILHCSKNSISSIVWIPEDMEKIDNVLKSKNRLFRKDINISEKNYSNLIIRFLSSDGATIIDTNGSLRYYGCIVDMEQLKIKGVKGTGESAASMLAQNGISIKISQDGTIKLFLNAKENPILI